MGEELFEIIWLSGAVLLNVCWWAYAAYMLGAGAVDTDTEGGMLFLWLLLSFAWFGWPLLLGAGLLVALLALPFVPFWWLGKRRRARSDTGER